MRIMYDVSSNFLEKFTLAYDTNKRNIIHLTFTM